jgi:Ni,Fe-hydrogenase III large subunit
MTFPLGPYHPALLEPLGLRLALSGEKVTGVEPLMGYASRGIEALAAASDLPHALDIVERTCGTCGHSHRLAMCLALERHADVAPPPRAAAFRTIFSEVERALARLWLLAQVGRVAEFGGLLTFAVESREMLFEACAAATDARLFWGVAVPGGAVNVMDIEALADPIAAVADRLPAIERLVVANGPLSRRGAKIGAIGQEAAEDLQLTGLVARASEAEVTDLRAVAPYDAYEQVADLLEEEDPLFASGTLVQGDVASRVRVAVADLRQSLRLAANILDDLPEGQERETFPPVVPPGEISASVEGPHGRETITLQLGAPDASRPVDTRTPGWLSTMELSTPSAANSGALPIALIEEQLGDVPLILASLDLCIACIDR